MIEWVDYMAELITQKCQNLDNQGFFTVGLTLRHTIVFTFDENMCELTITKHWLATKEYKIIDKIDEKDVPKNLCLVYQLQRLMEPYPSFEMDIWCTQR